MPLMLYKTYNWPATYNETFEDMIIMSAKLFCYLLHVCMHGTKHCGSTLCSDDDSIARTCT